LLEKSERIAQLVRIVEQTNDAFILFDVSRRFIFANDALESITGYSAPDIAGMSFFTFIETLGLPDFLLEAESVRDRMDYYRSRDVVIIKKNQSRADVGIRFEVISDEKGSSQYTLMVISDISERKLAEVELRVAATAFESQEGVMVTDAEKRILKVNRMFSVVTGYDASEVIGKTPSMLSSGHHDHMFFTEMWNRVNADGSWEGEMWNRRKNGEIYPQRLTITAVKDENSHISHYVGMFADISAYKEAEEKIRSLAFFDPLTGLPNRRLLMDRLNQALASSVRSGKEGALLFIDLDNFKTLNDTLGHDVGDQLLIQVAARLKNCIREGDTVARLGGDEFVVMLEGLEKQDIEAASQAEVVGDKILNTINMPYLLGSHEYSNSSSIGVTLFGAQSSTVDDLLKQADIAMYQAKKAGRNALRFFNPRMQEAISARVLLEAELTRAIDEKHFQLHYQIQMDNAGHPLGAEVLIRWRHAEHGLIAPLKFIPLAEETDLIQPIGQWVLETACAQLEAWQKNLHTRDLVLSVNVSSRQFRNPEFVSHVRMVLKRYAIDPSKLKLELTESLLLENIEDTIATMETLSGSGIQFALDDFGTGYSSLQYLKKLPLHQLKIDRSFVSDVAVNSSDQAIIRTIVAMAQSLNLEVIAEGVEAEEQLQFLTRVGCTQYQGYLFGKPVPVEEFEALIGQLSSRAQ